MAEISSSSSPTATVRDDTEKEGKSSSEARNTGENVMEAEVAQPSGSNKPSETAEDVEYTKDFGIIPMPTRLQYHPDKSFHFGLVLQIIFGFASTFGASLCGL